MTKAAVFAIIFDKDNRVLLAHRTDRDLWNLPGGGLENGESPDQGAIRETKEEIGVDVTADRLVGVYYKQSDDCLAFSFVCSIIAGELTFTDEADRIEYFKFEDIPRNTSYHQVRRIHDALQEKVGVFETQTGPNSYVLQQNGTLEKIVEQTIQDLK